MSEDYMKLEQRYSELEASFECLMQERNTYRQAMHESEAAVSVFQRQVEILERLNHAYALEPVDFNLSVSQLQDVITALQKERDYYRELHKSQECAPETKSCVIEHIRKHRPRWGGGND